MRKYDGIEVTERTYKWNVYKVRIINNEYIKAMIGSITTKTRSEKRARKMYKEMSGEIGVKLELHSIIETKYKMKYSELKDYVKNNGEKTIVENLVK